MTGYRATERMTAGVFKDCVFFIKVNHLSVKEKKCLKEKISSNGGAISYVLNGKCTHFIANNASSLSSSHLKKIEKHQISLVDTEFICKCIEENQLLEETSNLEKPINVLLEKVKTIQDFHYKNNLSPAANTLSDLKEEILDREYGDFEEEESISENAEVAKYCFLQKDTEGAILELLCFKEDSTFPFKISTRSGPLDGSEIEYTFYLATNSNKACERYESRIKDLKNKGFNINDVTPPEAKFLASEALQRVLLEETINSTTISREVGYFVESIWLDALGHLHNLLSCPLRSISLNDVAKAEGILLQAKIAVANAATPGEMLQLMNEFYRLIPHKPVPNELITKEYLTKKQELCQLIRDTLNVCETSPSAHYPSTIAKYKALRCSIELVDRDTKEFTQVEEQILGKNYSDESIKILNIFRIGRLSEAFNFQSKLENVKPLLHSSSTRKFVGILSRGLLLPKVISEDLGYKRTDLGNLGSGIYFTDSISSSLKYSEPSYTTGARLMVVCDVALGISKDFYKKDYTITEPPDGFHSVHGVRRVEGVQSEFEDDEFVVYNGNQVKMRYAIQFCTSHDSVSLETNLLSIELEEKIEDTDDEVPELLDESVLGERYEERTIKGGLQNNNGEQIPLERIHVKAKVMDIIAQVVIFQTYKNNSLSPIEAKYVFPLDNTATVCGFEAFINGKHIVGEVKEKQQAHKEYRTAISEGHGAYLMDQDDPDIFTVSVGNLPPNATVIIKITYITELSIQNDNCHFEIPGDIAAWQKDKALNENTQDTVSKVGIKEGGVKKGCFFLDMSLDMSCKIVAMNCWTHEIIVKKTDCKAVIQTKKGSSFTDTGFSLSIDMENICNPRMWVEKHPEKDSEACMLIFTPECPDPNETAVSTICLDCSNSMKECFQEAQLLALQLFPYHMFGEFNIIKFGSTFKEFGYYSREQNDFSEMQMFIKMAKPNMGNTEFWKPLHSVSLLAQQTGVHNIILISDGHIQNESAILQILKRNSGKIRLFVCGIGTTANRTMLRRLSQHGGGMFQYFDVTAKKKWHNKLDKIRNNLDNKTWSSVSVKWTQFNEHPQKFYQAPTNISALFPYDQLIVYGFIRHCTQAKLKAIFEDKEHETVVSTTELQKTTGTLLHKLTARALIRDFEEGLLHEEDDKQEMEKEMSKRRIIELSKEYSILTQFTSFVAVEKREADESQQDIEPDIMEILFAEDVDILPYMTWEDDAPTETESREETDHEEEEMFYECMASISTSHIKNAVLESEDYMITSYNECGADMGIHRLFDTGVGLFCDDLREASSDSIVDGIERDYFKSRSRQILHQEEVTLRPSSVHGSHGTPAQLATTLGKSAFSLTGTLFQTEPELLAGGSVFGSPALFPSNETTSKPGISTSQSMGFSLASNLQPPPPPPAAAQTFGSSVNWEAFGSPGRSPAPLATTLGDSALGFGLWEPEPLASGSLFGSTARFPLNKATLQPQKSRLQSVDFSFGAELPPRAPPPATAQTFGSSANLIAIPFGLRAPPATTLEKTVFGLTETSFPEETVPLVGESLFGRAASVSSNETTSKPRRIKSQMVGFSVDSTCRLPSSPLFPRSSRSLSSVTTHLPAIRDAPPKEYMSLKAASLESEPPVPLADGKLLYRSALLSKKNFSLRRREMSPPSWLALSDLQSEEGYWMLTPDLGKILYINVPYMIDVFLIKKGISSLGTRGREDICRLIATLLVLQAVRCHNLINLINFKSLMKLDDSSHMSEYYPSIEKAIKWARKADQQYPGICVRLGLGRDWDFATKQLLRIEPMNPSSELHPALLMI
ncbi:poly [ADP-ribose] polymerase 4 [Pelobates cultripes]|uniref:Poly [ADP-ribose] polymerase n=2 Tax=Pelobates cultripes TaxID=61616 RepID=A0AAD1R759_PELCU|nr:poly [ADP-ribose] polymerase 4 [Pelobates cultripes]